MKPVLYLYVDELPKFGNSDEDLNAYIYEKLKWPRPFDGTDYVLISLVITETGDIEDIDVVKALYEKSGIEAKKIFSNMPSWKPGKKDGKVVGVRLYIPVYFVVK